MIPCHNYARYLGTAIDGLLAQTHVPKEIVVVDDASDDNTKEIADRYASRGVRYLHGRWHSVARARNAGAQHTSSPFLHFHDADDTLPPTYLETCMKEMSRPNVAIVYGDMRHFGNDERYREMPGFDRDLLMRYNYISSHALIRRQAFDLVGGYRPFYGSHEDWDLYKRILQFPWTAVRANTFVYYRVHKQGKLRRTISSPHWTYPKSSMLFQSPLTIFTPLAGREEIVDQYFDALRNLEFDHSVLRLHLFDTSGDPAFRQRLTRAMSSLPFGRVTYTAAPLPASWGHTPQSIMRGRKDNLHNARYYYDMALVYAYNHLLISCDTQFALTLEDDILPAPNTLTKLLEAVTPNTVSVVAPYRTPLQDYWLVWHTNDRGENIHPMIRGTGIEAVDGSGFGCSLFRMNVLKTMPITTQIPWEKRQWYDHLAFNHLRKHGNVFCQWDAKVKHLSKATP